MALAQGTGDFSVVVLGSDFAVDAGAVLLNPADREEWHDCLPDLSAPADGEDFSDLEELQVVRVQGTDRAGRRIVRVVGRFFPGAPNALFSPPLLSFVALSDWIVVPFWMYLSSMWVRIM